MACKTYDKLCRWTLIYVLTLESTIDLGIEKTLQAIHRIDIGRWERRQVSNYKTWLSTKWFILEFCENISEKGSLRYRINTQITIQMSKYPKGQIQTELVLSFNFLEIKAIYDYVLLVTRNIMTHFQYHNIMFFLTYGWNNT